MPHTLYGHVPMDELKSYLKGAPHPHRGRPGHRGGSAPGTGPAANEHSAYQAAQTHEQEMYKKTEEAGWTNEQHRTNWTNAMKATEKAGIAHAAAHYKETGSLIGLHEMPVKKAMTQGLIPKKHFITIDGFITSEHSTLADAKRKYKEHNDHYSSNRDSLGPYGVVVDIHHPDKINLPSRVHQRKGRRGDGDHRKVTLGQS